MQPLPIRLPDDLRAELKAEAAAENCDMAELARRYIREGLERDHAAKSINLIAGIVRQQLEAVLKPSVERLAKLSSKVGHMSATSTFLNVQAFMELVPPEKRKDPIELYNKSRKMAVEYMKTPAEDLDLGRIIET